nr:MAG TPA: protein of unknown function (UPF0257) [Caudoviricetes sp.]
MKKIYLILIAIFFVSCGGASSGNFSIKQRTKCKNFPIEDFVAKYQKLNGDNDLARKQKNKEFEKAFVEAVKDTNLLAGVPFELGEMNSHNGKVMAQFRTRSWSKADDGCEPFRYPIDLICKIPNNIASSLVDNELYCLHGKFRMRIFTTEGVSRIFGSRSIPMCYTNEIRCCSLSILDDEDVTLGIWAFDVDSISPYTGRQQEVIYDTIRRW